MSYYIATILLHIVGAIIGLILTTPVKTPARWTLGNPKDIELKKAGKSHWEPLS